LALRFGHIFNEDTLVYALAGGVIGRIERKLTQQGNRNWFDLNYSTTERKNETGYVLGLGVEHKINTNLALRASYEYVDFGNISLTYNGPYDIYTNTINQSHKVDFSNLAVGLTYQF
jgi:opacity protein-like surface antigen